MSPPADTATAAREGAVLGVEPAPANLALRAADAGERSPASATAIEAGALEGTPCAGGRVPELLPRYARRWAAVASAALFVGVAVANHAAFVRDPTHSKLAGVRDFAALLAAVSLGTLAFARLRPLRRDETHAVRGQFLGAWASAAACTLVWFVGSFRAERIDAMVIAFAVPSMATLLASGLVALSAPWLTAAERVATVRAHDGRDVLRLGAALTAAWLALPWWGAPVVAPLALLAPAYALFAFVRALRGDLARLRWLAPFYREGDLAWRIAQRMPWAGAAPPGVRPVWTEHGAHQGLLLHVARAELGPFRDSAAEVPAALVPATYERARALLAWRYARAFAQLVLATAFHAAFFLLYRRSQAL